MTNLFNFKKIFLATLVLLLLTTTIYAGKGAWDHLSWIKTSDAVAAGGYTSLYAGSIGAVTPKCVYTSGKCTCSSCDLCGCVTYDEMMITNGQQVNNGAQFLCVPSTLQVKGTPLLMASGKQFISGSMIGQCLTANDVLATPSMAASHFHKFASTIQDFFIASKKLLK